MAPRPIYYDTETTGVRPAKDRIIELAAYDVERDKTFCSFVYPEGPIPPESTVISGITDEMVKGAPLFSEVGPAFSAFCEGDVVLIAHNNDQFDKLFLENEYNRFGFSMPNWLYFDTLKWSRKYRPDLPRHSLQFLRELFGIKANQAHRALDDVYVLYQVSMRLIDDLSWEEILRLMSQSSDISRMPFGKYAGKSLSEVPKDYVGWLAKNGALDKAENAALRENFIKLGLFGG
jgi:DNA polymerase-3 subunit epsilon